MPTQPQLRVINTGQHANDGTGDTLRSAAEKINANFDDVYSALGINGGSASFVNSIIASTGINVNHASGNVTITNTAPKFDNVAVAGNDTIVADTIHTSLTIAAGSNIVLGTDATTKTLTVTATDPRLTAPTDWNAASGVARILNKPAIFSGAYADLTGKPTIPAAQVNSDWNATNGVTQILNKPTVDTFQSDWLNGDPATLGYIKNKPTIATDVSQLSDTGNRLLVGAKNYTTVTNLNAGITGVVYTTAYPETIGLRGVIHVFISDGAGGLHIETAEVSMIVDQPVAGAPTIRKTFYNQMYTGLTTEVVFDAAWDAVSSRATITVQNNALTPVQVKATIVEYY